MHAPCLKTAVVRCRRLTRPAAVCEDNRSVIRNDVLQRPVSGNRAGVPLSHQSNADLLCTPTLHCSNAEICMGFSYVTVFLKYIFAYLIFMSGCFRKYMKFLRQFI